MKNWSDYPIFLAVAEAGSLTAAGRALGMSQPTVGRRIRALEDHFGTPLLKRENGQLVPTNFGQSMLDHIRRMQEEASAIDRSSATLEDSLSGVVRLSATEGIGTSWLPGVMQKFRAEHPDVLIDIGIGFQSFNLAQREADIALRWRSPGEQNSLIGRKVAEVGFGLFASPDYLSRRGSPSTPEDLVEHDGVLAQIMDGKSLWLMDDDGKMIYKPKRVTFNTNSIWAFDQALVHGYGIGVLPMCGVNAKALGLVRVLPEIVHMESLYLVAHQDLKRSMRIRAVFDYLVGAFREDDEFFQGLSASNYDCDACDENGGHNMLSPRVHRHKGLQIVAE
ncbi:LysR family transcriptional regulator [Litorimonas cladophorae]|uniref:LysR family transcriptional regulator n=1 Tax=Litorimonas cladophorae TaxID=1220491 RepID=A0A918NG56_9PROT|nr:LysR family transcriptional regulator [Litorimonas cladophorae]GGX68079.1 LysR family transcriptional regulator [Litorimonas cladophorae]